MRILIWGKGRDFNILMLTARWKDDVEIVGIIVSEDCSEDFLIVQGCDRVERKLNIYSAEKLNSVFFDKIVLANSFYKDIIIKNINSDLISKIIIPYVCEIQDKNSAIEKMEDIVVNPKETVIRISGQHKEYYVEPMLYDICDNSILYEDDVFIELPDYTRIRTTEMLIKELRRNEIEGEMAEVGVFRGRFVKIFSHYFPNKKLYLYDSFEGFEKVILEKEIERGNASEIWSKWFSNTSVKLVEDYIANKDRTFIRKGFFPETIEEAEKNDKFCLVSLDADLYEPILEGLRFFYPRLLNGGYILIHDYNSLDIIDNQYVTLGGVKKAVTDYEQESGIKLCKVPISDRNGTLIITK